MSSEYSELLKRFGDGKRVCSCEAAYLEDWSSRSSCIDGRCEHRARMALEEVAPKILKALRIVGPEEQSKLAWLDEKIDAIVARAKTQGDISQYERDIVLQAMTLAGVLPAGCTPAVEEIEQGAMILRTLPVAYWLAQQMLSLGKKL